ncbi:hypothetical protein VTL71DRAFT_8023 [Oculimacula yallundae]|uniref:Carboxylic ester hydrolase n=1 Tax=Oculimacula yallundae TaxID=86028 RepID=A0ABR4CWH3_9HELO
MASSSTVIIAYACILTVLIWTTLASPSNTSSWSVGQTVRTSSGIVHGHAAKNAPTVSEYLGIPYGDSCPSNGGFTFAAVLANSSSLNLAPSALQVLDSSIGQTGEILNEDCLTLNVWTKPQSGEKKKAVLLWIHGGGFTTGSSNNRLWNGQHFADSQDIVVVSINYRLNIFGFPGSPSTTNNLGLLDQRLAIEWTRDNIISFGGDPKRITLAGESAGAGSIDLYSYAWTHDPIANGFILQSGTAAPSTANASLANWLVAASLLGCNASSAATSILTCMRAKDQSSILKAIAALPDFGPAVDNVLVYPDTIARGLAGKFIHKPLLIGANDNELGLFRVLFSARGASFSNSWYTLQNLFSFNCGAALRAKFSTVARVPTWRYRYFGDFANLALQNGVGELGSGAWHGSEIPMVFGTDMEVQNVTGRSAEQERIGRDMQKAWAAFVKDPEEGLKTFGWPKYDPSSKTLVRLAYQNRTGPNLGLPADYDFACPWIMTVGQALLYSASTQTAVDVLAGLTRPLARQVLGLFEV